MLGHFASEAQMEQDFGVAGGLNTGNRSRLDAVFVDMSIFFSEFFPV